MRSWADALQPRPQHGALCAAVLAMARSAGARLAVRDAADGFIRLTHAHRVQLQQRGGQFEEHVAILLEAWDLAAAAPGGAALGRVGAIATGAEERVLLGLCAAPQLDRAVERAFRAVAHPDGELTVGAVLDLMSTAPASRLRLAGLLHPEAPLRRAALIGIDAAGAALASMRLAVAPAVVAALRGEPVAAPEGADTIVGGADAAGAADVSGPAAAGPGTLTLLTGPRRATAATLQALLRATGRQAWIVPGGPRFREQAIDYRRWLGWARDAALAETLLVADLDGSPLADTIVLARNAAAATDARLVLRADAPVGPDVDRELVVIACPTPT